MFESWRESLTLKQLKFHNSSWHHQHSFSSSLIKCFPIVFFNYILFRVSVFRILPSLLVITVITKPIVQRMKIIFHNTKELRNDSIRWRFCRRVIRRLWLMKRTVIKINQSFNNLNTTNEPRLLYTTFSNKVTLLIAIANTKIKKK